MSERKNIDRLFQEAFKEFEQTPPAESWEYIESKLEKKKRRVIPFWWRFSGIAALMVLGIFVLKTNFKKEDVIIPNNSVVEQNSTLDSNNKSNNESVLDGQKSNDNTILKENNSTTSSNQQNNSTSITNVQNNTSITTIETLNQTKGTFVKTNKNISNSKNKLSNKKQSFNTFSNAYANQNLNNEKENVIARNNASTESTLEQKNNSIAENTSKSKTLDNTVVESQKSFDNTLKKGIELKTEISKKSNDSLPTKAIAKNELEELLNEKESKLKTESKNNKWQISSNVAPVFLGSVSNGSSIDSMFTGNNKDYRTDLSIGVGVSYAVNSKLTLRTGVNKMRFNYNTDDVAFAASLQELSMKNITPTPQAQMMQIQNANSVQTSDIVPSTGENILNEGEINQEMGYIEVPLELTYAIVNKKIGIKLIGGMSTFFLNENRVSIVSENVNMTLGKANNLNNIHFSSNLGIGLNYNFWKKFDFNVEPTLKYQINTFSRNDGNFKPYFVGVYTGVSYKF